MKYNIDTGLIPGTVLKKGAFDGISGKEFLDKVFFFSGGLMLGQIREISGVDGSTLQNWVKRGFVSSPKKRLYSRGQFARIIIINMLRESLQIERICSLIQVIGGILEDDSDDLIGDDELYHRYVDMISDGEIDINNEASVKEAAQRATEGVEERIPGANRQLIRILQAMIYAHSASRLRKLSEEMISSMK